MKIKKNWIRTGNVFNLFVEYDNEIMYKKFRVYNDLGCQPIVDLNKKLKEFDMIESLRKKYNIEAQLYD